MPCHAHVATAVRASRVSLCRDFEMKSTHVLRADTPVVVNTTIVHVRSWLLFLGPVHPAKAGTW